LLSRLRKFEENLAWGLLKDPGMRKARIELEQPKYFHCISRIIERRFLLDEVCKEKFVGFMRRMEAFSGVTILTHTVMDNHFHILLAENEPVELKDAELLERVRHLYGADSNEHKELEERLAVRQAKGKDSRADELQMKYEVRMNNVSEFMKTLKQRFTEWYNRREERKGTLWEGCFKSVLGPNREVMRSHIFPHDVCFTEGFWDQRDQLLSRIIESCPLVIIEC